MTTGKVCWSTDTTPNLIGLVGEGERITALVVVDESANAAAILEPATGAVRGNCQAEYSALLEEWGKMSTGDVGKCELEWEKLAQWTVLA